MPVTPEVVRLMGESMEQLIVENTRVITRRARIKLFLRACLPPWPLRQFERVDIERGLTTKVGGWLHDNGTVYITYIRYTREER